MALKDVISGRVHSVRLCEIDLRPINPGPCPWHGPSCGAVYYSERRLRDAKRSDLRRWISR